MTHYASLTEAACAVLTTPGGRDKATLSRVVAAAWARGEISVLGAAIPPDRPARPGTPELLPPAQMPRRRSAGSTGTRIALLHALAHIELNAIDLAWDLIARFAADDLPREFFDQWVTVAAEEGLHFLLIEDRLAALSAHYGALPAHDGLWEAATETAHDLRARLAIVPMVLEARGLDVTPAMIGRFERSGDEESAAILRIVLRDEIGHVAVGKFWFDYLCARTGDDSPTLWRNLVRTHFRGALKPPFNREAREKAGFPPDLYLGADTTGVSVS
ncbi:ferritin-like domain-containing protein [Iodidimonas sp. SYSU 1G8]|uniref:ferritin-like domain-containing protein n=1 Tax=Iodidimonas sp. SYSU 1G8 TaxID=3133967 RepID=UPI0031FF0EFA